MGSSPYEVNARILFMQVNKYNFLISKRGREKLPTEKILSIFIMFAN